MSLTGGKRKVNKSLKAWVAFVKKVQKEEKLSYKDAIHRAKQRKDKGEKWMTGGQTPSTGALEYAADMFDENAVADNAASVADNAASVSDNEYNEAMDNAEEVVDENGMSSFVAPGLGGRRRRRTMRRSRGRGRGRGRGRTARRARGRASRRH
jgi:hypothetical protein